ncbi:heterokaryon incompatibility protein [Stagonosporopsis vannaccii]|nr:heterokaryon incompatibility protein [Stagonosporopsis vannaccii]
MSSNVCRHTDVWNFDGLKSCLSCGETIESVVTTIQYHHTSLDTTNTGTIRLIELQPGIKSDPVYCRIEHHILADNPIYDAVSYTWATEDGEDSQSQEINIIGHGIMNVTRNCKAALLKLRRMKSPRRLWIDSICIDQTNIVERNHQVRFMDLIYRNAEHVHICISRPEVSYSSCLRWLQERDSRLLSINDRYMDSATSELVRAVQELFQLRYFGRVWVLQEVALARSVYLHVNDDEAHLSNHSIGRLNFQCASWDIDVPGPLKWLSATEFDLGIVPWLQISWRSACKDPRDKIFAIRSLLDPSTRDLIPVDYSLSLEQVIANAIVACVRATRSIAIIAYAHFKNSCNDVEGSNFGVSEFDQYIQAIQIPISETISRCRERDTMSRRPGFGTSDKEPWSTLQRSNNTPQFLPQSHSPRPLSSGLLPRLKVQAHLIDKSLGYSTSILLNESTLSMTFDFSDSWIGNIGWIKKRFSRPNPNLPDECLAKTRDSDGNLLLSTNPNLFAGIYNVPDIEHFNNAINPLVVTTGVVLFKTYYSLGASQYPHRKGDLVFGIKGLSIPFVLRKVEDSVYRIVQPCYLWAAWQLDYWNPGTQKGVWFERPVDLGPMQARTIEIY